MTASLAPISLDQVADQLEHLLVRYEELQKASVLMQEQLLEATQERDSLRSRLAAARARVDALLQRLPEASQDEAPTAHAAQTPIDGEA
ncbi:MAG: DUF904 domain-containing protein [Brachymonas sp.]|nr:DUF904 domain-containing protein [Brachymonas sp.]